MALDPPRVHIKAYSGQAVHSLGSCILYLHIDIKMFPTIFEVTNTAGPILLGRRHVKAMGYVNFPKIRQPHKPITKINMSKKIYSLRVPTSHSNTRNAMNETHTHQPAMGPHT